VAGQLILQVLDILVVCQSCRIKLQDKSIDNWILLSFLYVQPILNQILISKQSGETMKIRVNKEMCIGDETCVEVCPELFEMQGDAAAAKMENVPKDLEDKVKEAATSCPVEAIIIE